MIKITVEEVEILITTKIEDNLKQNMPKIKQMVETIKQQFEKVDMSGFQKKTQQAVEQASKSIKNIKNTGTDKALESQFEKAGQSVEKYQNQLEQTKQKLREVYAQMDNKVEKTWTDVMPDGLNRNNPQVEKAVAPVVDSTLANDSGYQKLITQEGQLNAKIDELNSKLQQAKQNYADIGAQIQQSQSKQNIFTKLLDKAKTALKAVKGQANDVKGAFSKLPSLTTKVNTKIKQMSGGMKTGIKHVLKYAMALFSLRGIYSVLSNSAQSWLSSQNKGAQQLSANIEYMKYAMGSAFAPIIEYVVNLMYQLMKTIQSVVYAFSGINIFAKATASSMNKTAGSASKASKSLAGVHNEINNVSENDNGSESGSATPSMDLSTLDTSLVDSLSNLNFEELGTKLGEKLNEALSNIPWDSIKEKAKNIGTNIASFLNGFIKEADWNNVGNTLAQGLNTAIEFAYSFITTFDFKKFGKSIGESVNGFFEKVDWNTAGKTFGEGIKGIFNSRSSFLQEVNWSEIVKDIEEFLKSVDWSGIATSIFTAIGSAFGAVTSIIGQALIDALSSITSYFGKEIDECGGNVVDGIFKGIEDALSGIGKWINEHIFQPFIDGFKEAFKINSPSKVMEEQGNFIIEGLKNGLLNAKDTILEAWEKVKSWFTDIIKNASVAIKQKWSDIKAKWEEITKNIKDKTANMKAKVASKWSDLKKNWSGITDNIKDKTASMKAKVGSKWSDLKDSWNKLMKNFKDKAVEVAIKIAPIIDNIKKWLNNNFVDKVNNVLPDWIPNIPRFAKGNVATEETLAIFGEYAGASSNPEITTPQNIMRETFEDVLSGFEWRSNNNQSEIKQLVIQFGSQRVALEMENLIKQARRRNGTAYATI